MKTAICISGICRGNVAKNIESVRRNFPNCDVFYATWIDKETDISTLLPGVRYNLYKQPKLNYHPIADIKELPAPKIRIQREKLLRKEYSKQWRERTKHHTKQILIHDYLLKDIPSDYDMIIRSRFDTFIVDTVNINSYLKRSYKENIAIGFGTRDSRHPDINIIREVPRVYPDGKDTNISQDWGWYLMDPLIIHPRKLWNHKLVTELHNSKKLAAAEFGWYQILSQPYSDSHVSVYGGVQIEKYL